MKIVIVYWDYYNLELNSYAIGGVETYISNLRKVFYELNISTIVVTCSKEPFRVESDFNTILIGTGSNDMKSTYRVANQLYEEGDILIFGASIIACKTSYRKTIGIQHGIPWDSNTIRNRSDLPDWLSIICRAKKAYETIKRDRLCSRLVCVDYNYINWFRTQTTDRSINYFVIPNFVDTSWVHQNKVNNSDTIRIVYARRFEKVRGTDLICDAMPAILDDCRVTFTIAGDGSQKKELEKVFGVYKNVFFTKYRAEDSLQFHNQFDIAIVPSVASEGTSLSLLEAMKAGCVVVCTDIGGMTNIVLDGYNGRIVKPNARQLQKVLYELINNAEQRKILSRNAIETAENAFSFERWKNQWKTIITEMIDQK